MAINIPCSWCGHKVQADDSMAGRTIKCPKCKELLTLPGGGEVDLFGDDFADPPAPLAAPAPVAAPMARPAPPPAAYVPPPPPPPPPPVTTVPVTGNLVFEQADVTLVPADDGPPPEHTAPYLWVGFALLFGLGGLPVELVLRARYLALAFSALGILLALVSVTIALFRRCTGLLLALAALLAAASSGHVAYRLVGGIEGLARRIPALERFVKQPVVEKAPTPKGG